MTMQEDVKCFRCWERGQRWLGEAPRGFEFVGFFKYPDDRQVIPEPRFSWRCGKCGWTSVFQIAQGNGVPSWRAAVELKQRTG